MRSRARGCGLGACFALAIAFVAPQVYGQQDAGVLRVLVTDSSGASVAGATVKATSVEDNVSSAQVTGGEGYATFSPIRRGTYVVEVSKPGFRGVRTTEVGIDVNQTRLVRTELQPATVSESVEVTATAAALQTEESSQSQVLQGQIISSLPLAVRRYTDLALLAPGATQTTLDSNIRGTGWLVINGNWNTQNNFLLDGFDNNNATHNMQSRSAQVVQPSPDALSEFKVQTSNYSAEFGRAAGGVINSSIRSGGNSLHGSAWLYNRNQIFSANSWGSNLIGAQDDLTWNQTGGTLGGPIKRDKFFYFVDYEGFWSTTSAAQYANVPTAAMRTGNFSSLTIPVLDPTTGKPFAGNIISSDRFDSLGSKLINLFPAPTNSNVGAGGRPVNNFAARLPTTESIPRGDGRADYYASVKNRFFVRYSFTEDGLYKQPIFPGVADTGQQDGGAQYARNQSLGAAWTRVLSNTIVNDARFGMNRTVSFFTAATNGGQTGTAFGFKGLPASLDSVGGIPGIVLTNYHPLGTGPWRPQFANPVGYQANDAISIVHGAHTMKMGLDFHQTTNSFVDLQYRTVSYSLQGRYTNDDAAELLLGLPQSVSGSTFYEGHMRQNNWGAYFQDDWKIRPNLTLNLGLRYEYITPFYGLEPFTNVNVNYAKGGQLEAAPGGQPLVFGAVKASNKYTLNPTYTDFGPRLGLSYQMRKRIVLRAGYSIYYDGADITGSTGNLLLNAPNVFVVTLQRAGTGPAPVVLSQALPSNFLDTSQVLSSNLGFESRTPDWIPVKIQQWNVGLQFMVTNKSVFELAYVGNYANHLGFAIGNVNRSPYGVDGSIPANRPLPRYNTVEFEDNIGVSNYNSMQVKFEKQFSSSWYSLMSYVWASALADTEGFGVNQGSAQNINWVGGVPIPNADLERGPNFEVPRHHLSEALVWKVPVGRGLRFGRDMNRVANAFLGGWQTSLILTARSGLPVNVTLATTGVNPLTGTAYSFLPTSGGSTLRPNCVGNANTGISPETNRFSFLNVNAFQLQPLNTPGNCGRNVARGPIFWNSDVGVTKQFKMWETKTLDLRFESFNLFNHTNFQLPASVWGGANFGVITTAYSPRQIQMAIRFAF